MFLEGNRLFKIPLFAQAVEKYTEAIGKWRHPAFYFNLALAQLNLGQDVEAQRQPRGGHAARRGAAGRGRAPGGQEAARRDRAPPGPARGELPDARRGGHAGRRGAAHSGPGRREVWVKARAHEITAKQSEYVIQSKRVTVGPGRCR